MTKITVFNPRFVFICFKKLAGRSIKVAFTEAGKPYSPAGGICFSFSHTATLALCAVAEFPVGIDASPRLAYDGSIAALVCSEAELERLKFSSDAGKLLTQYITRKESRIKLTGGTLRDIGEKREDMEHYRTIIVDGQVCSVCFKDKNAISNSL
ncbi:MAG: 4'-phosphopantetheinyl transferase family protein [Christensenellaceae bacterium]